MGTGIMYRMNDDYLFMDELELAKELFYDLGKLNSLSRKDEALIKAYTQWIVRNRADKYLSQPKPKKAKKEKPKPKTKRYIVDVTDA